MDHLMQEIADMEAQEMDYDFQLSLETNDAEVRRLIDEKNAVSNRLNEKRDELRKMQEEQKQRADQIEEKVYAEDIPFSVAGIDGMPPEVMKFTEEVVRADRRRSYNEHAVELEQLETEKDRLQTIVDAQGKMLELSEQNVVRLQIEIEDYQKRHREYELLIEDAESKRDAAVAQLEEANKEIARLKSEIEDHQRAKVWGERQAQNIIDVTPEENKSIVAAAEAVKKLFVSKHDWGSVIRVDKPDGTFELVKRKELESEWAPIDVPEVPSFQSQNEPAGAEPSEHGADPATTGADVGDVRQVTAEIRNEEAKSVEERLWQLECDVSRMHEWLQGLSGHVGYKEQEVA